MPRSRSLILAVPVTHAAAALFVPLHPTDAAPDPTPTPTEPAKTTGIEVEVKCIDDSTLKLKLLDEKLELVTKYGFLQITVADIRRIDFAARCPADVAEKISLAISKLGHPDFQTRERATAELKGYRERAYPFVLKAIKHDDPEVSRRADEAAKYIQAKVPAGMLEPRENDVIFTEDSKITGKLTAQSMHVLTAMFGEQSLKLSDLRSLRSASGMATDELAGAIAGPATLASYQQQFGKELVFHVTGYSPANGQQPSLWGTDVYSIDSNLSAAVVHAGLAKAGEAVVVRVRIIQSPAQYVASFRNGITSSAYNQFPSGAFEFIRK
jgi:hypothetical protein